VKKQEVKNKYIKNVPSKAWKLLKSMAKEKGVTLGKMIEILVKTNG